MKTECGIVQPLFAIAVSLFFPLFAYRVLGARGYQLTAPSLIVVLVVILAILSFHGSDQDQYINVERFRRGSLY